jgi:hypothetical protein
MMCEEYAARHADDTLTFLSEDFERFKAGAVVLDCTVRCSFAYGSRKGDWRTLHEKRAWRDLAISVMQAGYLSDLSYFLLGEAARGLGLEQAAATYYRRALDAGRQHGCAADCEGFKVEALARAALRGCAGGPPSTFTRAWQSGNGAGLRLCALPRISRTN